MLPESRMTKDYYRRNRYRALSRRRLKIDLIIVILQCVGSMEHIKEREYRLASPTNRICNCTRMNHTQLKAYLSLLRDGGLIREKVVKFTLLLRSYSKPRRQVQIFCLSKKGNKFLQLHKMMLEFKKQSLL
jgi:hypothetical protein